MCRVNAFFQLNLDLSKYAVRNDLRRSPRRTGLGPRLEELHLLFHSQAYSLDPA